MRQMWVSSFKEQMGHEWPNSYWANECKRKGNFLLHWDKPSGSLDLPSLPSMWINPACLTQKAREQSTCCQCKFADKMGLNQRHVISSGGEWQWSRDGGEGWKILHDSSKGRVAPVLHFVISWITGASCQINLLHRFLEPLIGTSMAPAQLHVTNASPFALHSLSQLFLPVSRHSQ